MNSEHVPVPSDHAPRKQAWQFDEIMVVTELKNDGAWIRSTNHVEVTR